MVNANKRKLNLLKNVFGTTKGSIIFNIINYLIFVVIALIMAYPFLYVIDRSLFMFKNISGVPTKVFSFEAYGVILQKKELLWSFVFTLMIVVATIVGHLLVTMLAAYSLSKKDLWGRKVIMLIIIFSMLFSGGLIPYYLLIAKTLKLTDNFLVYILPDLANGYNTIIAINFIRGLPDGVEEAASIDGANYWQIFTRIIMPLSFPIMATIGLWIGVGKWNSWYTTTLFIRDRDLITFQNYLQSILSSATGGNGSVGQIESESAKMAAIVIGVLPIVAIYPFVQKHFVKGTLLGSVKE